MNAAQRRFLRRNCDPRFNAALATLRLEDRVSAVDANRLRERSSWWKWRYVDALEWEALHRQEVVGVYETCNGKRWKPWREPR